jgi:N-acetylmuramoyl-L-alanine amidase
MNPPVARRGALLALARLSRWTAILAVLALLVVGAYAVVKSSLGMQVAPDAYAPGLGVASQPIGRPRHPHVGIVAGHWGYDSGAVCADGLTEQNITLDIARRAKRLLEARSYRVDLLQEFDPRLNGYVADALVSLHVDSCEYINDIATGFKVARSVASYTPEAEDRLVDCLVESYGAATGLGYHENSITPDMTSYHTFSEVAPKTPAAIIEIGFLYLDRYFLASQPDRAASGIADGVACFVESR